MLIVEVLNNDFQVYENGKPTGHYARGIVIKENSYQNTLLIECLSNGKRYEVNKQDIKVIIE